MATGRKLPATMLTDSTIEKKRKEPPACNGTPEMKVYIDSFFTGKITYREILFLILAKRHFSGGVEERRIPPLAEVQQEYARLRAHLLTCGACLRRVEGISPRFLALLD
jgi:hypothetical protein